VRECSEKPALATLRCRSGAFLAEYIPLQGAYFGPRCEGEGPMRKDERRALMHMLRTKDQERNVQCS